MAVGSSTITVNFTPTDSSSYGYALSKTYTITVTPPAPTLGQKLRMDDQGASSYSSSLLTAIENKTARDFSTTATADEVSFAGGVTITNLSNTSFYLYSGQNYWLILPGQNWGIGGDYEYYQFYLNNDGIIGTEYPKHKLWSSSCYQSKIYCKVE
ncbi:hypothetical protein J6Z48_02615 [bacterium]|nr:hypothetical protein [bacterium]